MSNLTRRSLLALAGIGAGAGLTACRRTREESSREREPRESETTVDEQPEVDLGEFEQLAIDMSAWQYDEQNDCYYQLELPYCLAPASEQYGTFAIFVPGAYFVGERTSRGYACTIAEDARVGEFTPRTAPVALPINAIRFGAQASPATYDYEGLARYLEAGFVYVYVGFRGRTGGYESTTQEYYAGGAPWAATELKAAIRCLRYNAAALPCDTTRVFAFGCGGGGGYSALLGASGDASSYEPYLQSIGAATHDAQGEALSDGIAGSASWCPLTSCGAMGAAYEWTMGQFATTETREEGTWTAALSKDMTSAYASYVNDLELTDADGTVLALDRIDDGSYLGGTYYEYLLGLLRDAAADFLAHTTFPYASTPSVVQGPYFPGDPAIQASAMGENTDGDERDSSSGIAGVRQVEATVFESAVSYIAYLNGDNRWLTYNATRETADVTGLWDFVPACRAATRAVSAYDTVDCSGVLNQLFGTDQTSALHFDALVAELLSEHHEEYAEAKGWDEGLVAQWNEDLVELDALETTVEDRVAMSDPLAFLRAGKKGVAEVASFWRINTGLFQSVTPLATEMNLALAAAQVPAVREVSFEPVWGTGYGLAEREGDAEDNLVAWVTACCAELDAESDDGEEADEKD